jgi:hypothetical protein
MRIVRSLLTAAGAVAAVLSLTAAGLPRVPQIMCEIGYHKVIIGGYQVCVRDPARWISLSPKRQGALMVTMYDAGIGNRSKIPASAPIVAGGGKWTPAMFAQWPHATHVTIAESAGDTGKNVIDYERKFLWSPAGLRRWVKGHQAAGLGPGVVYVGHQNLPIVRAALAGISPKPYLWIADQTGTRHMYPSPPGWRVIATQWFGSRQPSWQGVDVSEVSDVAALHGAGSTSRGGGGTSGSSSSGGSAPGQTLYLGPSAYNQAATPAAALAAPGSSHVLLYAAAGVLVVVGAVYWRGRGK